jgi:hypothetical protein
MADISATLVLDDNQYTSRIAAAQAAAGLLGSKLHSAGKEGQEAMVKLGEAAESVKSKMEGLGVAIVGLGFAEFIKSSLESVSEMVDLANTVGIATQSMMEFQLAGLAAGKSGADVANMMQKMNLAAQNAAEGNTKARSALNELGVTNEYLRTHSTEETFKKVANALAAIEDPGKRAALALEATGKGGTKIDWKDMAGNIDKYAGSQKDAAEATEAAKKIMDEMAIKAQEVKNQFVMLAKPILDFVAPMMNGMNGAAIAAKALAAAMGLFAVSGIIGAIRTIVSGVSALFTSMTASTAATALNTEAMLVNSRVVGTYMAGALGRAGTAAAALATAQSELNAVMAVGVPESAALAAAQNAIAVAEGRVAITTAAAAATMAGSGTAISAMGMASGAAVVPVTALSGAMTGLNSATLLAARTVGLFIALMTATDNLNMGEDAALRAQHKMEDGFKDLTKTQQEEFFKMSAADQKRITDMLAAGKKMKDAWAIVHDHKPEGSTISTEEVDLGAAAVQGLKNQTDALRLNNSLAVQRLALETSLADKTNVESTSALAAFDAKAKKATEELRIAGQIKILGIEISNASKMHDTAKMSELGAQVTALKQQGALYDGQVDAIAKGTAELTKATNEQKLQMYYTDLNNKLKSDQADIQDQINQSTMTGDEKKLDAINKQYRAAVDGAVKLKAAQLGRQLTDPEKTSIEAEIKPKFAAVTGSVGDLNSAEAAGKKRVFYEEQAFKIAANIRDLKMSTDELTMTNDEVKMNSIRRAAQTEIDSYIKMRAESIGLKAAEDERASVTQRILDAHLSEATAMQHLIDKSREFSTGWNKAWKDYSDAATNASQRASDMFGTFSNAFESAFDQMVRTGKVSWNSLLTDMVASMMKSDVKRLFADLMAPTAGGKSSIWSGIGSLFHASGGDIPAGQMGIVGEVRPEVVQGPARVGPSTGSAAQNVTYNINAVDARSFQQLVAADPSFLHAVVQRGARSMPGGA